MQSTPYIYDWLTSAPPHLARPIIVRLGYKNIPVNLDDAPRWNGKRIDKEIGLMSARSAQRTRWRRWRMGRDIAGGKDRDGRLSGQAGTSCRRWRRGEASPSSSSEREHPQPLAHYTIGTMLVTMF